MSTKRNRKEESEKVRMKAIHPEVWVDRVSKFEPELRDQLINIIWWDWFSEREVPNRWNHFDDAIKRKVAITAPAEVLLEALIQCGYSRRLGRIRLNMNAKNLRKSK
jgi:hypothetical protein